MAWVMNILEGPYLPMVCKWDAVKLDKFDGKEWVHFMDEPWSGTHMWGVQVSYFEVCDLKEWLIIVFSGLVTVTAKRL
jgi:hypothetical protein